MEDLNLPTISSKGQENIGFEAESTSVDAEIELKLHYNKQDLANGNSHHNHSKGHGHGHSHEHGHSHDHEEDTSYNGELLRKSETSASFHCHDEGETSEGDETNRKAKRILWLSVLICMFFMVCEIVGGYIANSLAIVTDAAHLLTDLASMLISLFSLYIASRPASQKMSWGFHRAEVLGAFFSVFLIWIVTGVLVVLAVKRIIKGDEEVDAKIMAITASMGVLVNLIMGGLLFFGGGHGHSHGGSHGHSHGGAAKKKKSSGHGHSHSEGDEEEGHGHSHKSGQNINVRAAFVHVLGDLVQSVGVLIAALVILIWPHMSVMDPICTLLFSVIVLSTTIYVLRDALVVLLEGRPSNVNFSEVFASLNGIEGVKKVHDLRIWALTMDKVALSVHLEVESESQSQKILRSTRVMLKNQYSVHESTVQIELYAQEKDDCGKCVPLK